MAKKKIKTVAESLYWSYANLGMAHTACSKGSDKYGIFHFKVRSRLFSGLMEGTMNVRDLIDDERLKMILPQACCYCGSKENLSVDHIIPKSKGGSDAGENLIWSCRSCNSSKGSKDMLEWLTEKNQFPPILLLRRYLKLAINACKDAGIMEMILAEFEIKKPALPFSFHAIPHDYPQANELKLWIVPFDK